jgi:hypothetical protein
LLAVEMRFLQGYLIMSLALAVCAYVPPAQAVTVQLDYTYDTGFFAPGTPARATLVAAAKFYSSVLDDTLAAIPIGPRSFSGSAGTIDWDWTLNVAHPGGQGTLSLSNATVAENAIMLYAASQTFADNTLAVGSTGTASVNTSGPPVSKFNLNERVEILALDSDVDSTILHRGEHSGFVTWGGSISVDRDTNWHYDYLTPPTPGTVDLYTVLLHELAHTIGFGVSPQWSDLVVNGRFAGATAINLYGDSIPLASGNTHWAGAPGSPVFGGSNFQVALMTTSLTTGIRRHLTELDAAALTDLGWTVVPPGIPGDYNDDGIVNAADYTVWRNSIGQGSDLAADGNYDGAVGSEDYAIWKASFGAGSGLGAGSVASSNSNEVPEPAGSALLVLAGCWGIGARRRLRLGRRT